MTDHCPGIPFAAFCCDEHHEREVREAAWQCPHSARILACTAGVHPEDMVRFLTGHVSLTRTLRERVLGKVRETS